MSVRDRVVSKQRLFAHLRALAASKKTGNLIVTEPGVERRLYFEEGAVVAAASTLREESMGYLLAERDIVKANKVEQAEDLLGDKASLLGRKLVELGAMSEDEVGNAVRLKVRETISNMLANPEAEITLNDEKFPDVDRVRVSIDVDKLLAAGIEAAEKKVVTRATEDTNPFGTTEETITLEQEPEEALALPVDETDDPDNHLMQALEGFTERYSREPATGPRTVGPITKPYAVVPEQRTGTHRKPAGTSRLPVGIVAAGIVGVALLGGGYWFFTQPPEQSASRVADPVEAPAITDQTAPSEPEQASSETAEPAPDLSASLSPQAAPRAPARAAPAPPSSTASPTRQPVQRSAAAPTPQPAPARPAPRQQASAPPPAQANPAPARPAPRQQAPAPPPAQANPAPAVPEPAPEPQPEPPAGPPAAETEPTSPQPEPEPPAQAVQPSQAQQGELGNWGSAIFAPKKASVGAAPKRNPGLQTGDYVEPSFDVIEPVLIEHPKLKYPEEAKRQKIPEAVVRVRVLVDHTGAVQETEIVKGAGHGFDEVALAAAAQAKFIPATKGQVQVKTWTILPLVFRLDD